jgi:hypothetical protein
LIDRCSAQRREEAAEKTRRKGTEHDDTPSP